MGLELGPPPHIKEMDRFEAEMIGMVKEKKFRKMRNNIQQEMYKDMRRFKESESVFVKSDKSGNLYEIIIIIIMSCRQHRYPWPPLVTSPYHSSPPAGLQSYIMCPHIVAVCKFELVVLLHAHMWGSIGVHPLWARPCFCSSVHRVWFVLLV